MSSFNLFRHDKLPIGGRVLRNGRRVYFVVYRIFLEEFLVLEGFDSQFVIVGNDISNGSFVGYSAIHPQRYNKMGDRLDQCNIVCLELE